MDRKHYKAVFIDIDDTLLDFKKCSQSALEESCKYMGVMYSPDLYDYFHRIDKALWDRQKKGELNVNEVLQIRFETLCKSLPREVDAYLFNRTFQRNLANTCVLIQGAKEILHYLSTKHTLFAASNGILEMQTSRLKLSGLHNYFKDLFVSDAIGFEKPDRRFFTHCLKESNYKSVEVLFIGDSWEADVEGAMQVGIDACWFTKEPKGTKAIYKPNFQIDKLNKLQELV